MTSAGCPDLSTLQALIAGLLDADDEQNVSEHLDHCTDCQRRLELTAGRTQLLHDVQERLSAPDNGDFPGKDGVLSRFHSDLASGSERTITEGTGPNGDYSTVSESEFEAGAKEQVFPLIRSVDIEIVEEIGRGGMGVVYRGYETRLGRDVAIKMLARRLAVYPEARERFIREARSLAALQHPYIVTIHRIIDPLPDGATDHLPCLVMEYVDGESLEARLRRKGALSLKEMVRTSIQIAAALSVAHERHIIHRDIKPANILLERTTRSVKLTDFGLARAADDVTLTQSGTLVGTPGYMSPEQAEGQRLDHRSDLFSLGSVMHAMLTGTPPFGSRNALSTLGQIINHTPQSIQASRDDVPEWLLQIIHTLHAKDPADRIQTAEEVVRALQVGRSELTAGSGNRDTQRARTVPGPEPSTGLSQNRPPVGRLPAAKPVVAMFGVFMLLTMIGIAALSTSGWLFPASTSVPATQDRESSEPPLTTKTDVPVSQPRHHSNGIVLYVDGHPDGQQYRSLADVVAVAPDGAVIELQTNGPLLTPPLNIADRTLTIRSGIGFRPEIALEPPLPGKTISVGFTALLTTQGKLSLEGLSLTVDKRRRPPEMSPVTAIVECRNGNIRIANCRLLLLGDGACLRIDSPHDCQLKNCELFSPDSTGIKWLPNASASLLVHNTLLTGLYAVSIQNPRRDAGQPALHLEQSTLSTIHTVRFPAPAEKPNPAAPVPQVTVMTDDTVLDAHKSVLQFDIPAVVRPTPNRFQPWEIPEIIRAAMAWQHRSTLFNPPQTYMSWKPASQKPGWPPWQPRRLQDWSHFWNLTDFPQTVSQPVQYVTDFETRTRFPPPAGVATAYQITNRSSDNVQSQPGIKSGIVGPGPAFDRWRQTPAWQAWTPAADH